MIFHKYNKQIVLSILGAICIGFVALTVLVCIFPRSFVDVEFSQEVQEHQNPLLDSAMKAVSWLGYFPASGIVVAVTSLLFLLFNYRREALFVLLTSLSGIISTLVKLLVNRPRPAAPLVRVVAMVNQQSFPSGHVLFYIVFLGFLTVLMNRLKTIKKFIRITVSSVAMLLILTVPVSRIYLGAHWFTDVLGGFLLGILCLYPLCYFYLEKPEK